MSKTFGIQTVSVAINAGQVTARQVDRRAISPASPVVVGIDGRVYTLNAAELIARSNNRIVIDENHSTHKSFVEKAPAMGWASNLAVSSDGQHIEADIVWNAAGAELISQGLYEYFSPTYYLENDGISAYALASIGLVNAPNFPDLTALNAAFAVDKQNNNNSATAQKESKNMTEEKLWAELTKAQGDLVAANAAKVAAEAKLVQLEAENKALQEKNQEVQLAANKARLEGMLDQAIGEGKVAVAEREALLAVNSAEVLAGILAARVAGPAAGNAALNSSQVAGQAVPQGQGQNVQLNAAQLESAKAYGMSPEEYYQTYVAPPAAANGGQK